MENLTKAKKVGIILLLAGIILYFLINQSYQWIPGALCGAGFALLFLFGAKKAN